MSAPALRFSAAALATLLYACGDATKSNGELEPTAEVPHAFELRLSQRLLNPSVSRTVKETTPLNEWQQGAWVSGQADQTGEAKVELVASSDNGVIETVYVASTLTKTSGQRHPATFWTTAETTSTSKKQLILTIDEIKTKPAETRAETAMQIDGLNVDAWLFHRLIYRRAWGELCGNLPQASATINARTIAAVNERLNKEHEAAIATSGLIDLQRSAQKLRAEAKLGNRVRFASSGSALSLVADDIESLPQDPPVFGDADTTVRLSESFVNNTAIRTFGGETLNETQIRQRIEAMFGPMLEQDTAGTTAAAATPGFFMRFPITRPLTISLRDGVATITIRGESFKTPNNNYELPMEIKAAYAAAGESPKLVRQGEISVLPVGWSASTGRMTMKQQVLAGELKQRFDAVLKPDITKDELKLPGSLTKDQKLVAESLTIQNGWLKAAWKIAPK